jgi:hypothetical protein
MAKFNKADLSLDFGYNVKPTKLKKAKGKKAKGRRSDAWRAYVGGTRRRR